MLTAFREKASPTVIYSPTNKMCTLSFDLIDFLNIVSRFFLFRNITILSRLFVMLVLLFCKLFEHYSQTNFPTIKTKPFKVTKYKKNRGYLGQSG